MTAPSPTRVLYCEGNTDGTVGGSHYCLLHLVERLDRTRFEPIVMFYQDHTLVPRFRATAETVIRPPHNPWRAGRAGLLGLPLALLRRAVNLTRLAALVRDEVRWLREQRIDLVHLNNSITRHHDWMAAALIAGVPCVTHERGINRRYSLADRELGRRLALVIPVSAWVRDHMVARGVPPGNLRVMYDGIDPGRLQVTRTAAALREEWNVGPDQPVIGIVGNVRGWKGQEVVVRAMAEVVRHRRDAVCFIVGATGEADQAYLERLQGIVRDSGIEQNVRFTGYQNRVPDFVNMMAVVVHASIEPEPFGMVVLEAMALKKPVIGSASGGVIEMVVNGRTGYTFTPGDSAELAGRILELLADPAAASRMGQAAYDRVIADFPLDDYVRSVEGIYDQALRGRQGVA